MSGASRINQALSQQGVFKGHDGLLGLLNADAFWEQQPYGTRLYYGDGYLHRSVLRAAVDALAQQPCAIDTEALTDKIMDVADLLSALDHMTTEQAIREIADVRASIKAILDTALEGGERAGTEEGTPVEESRPLAESGSSPQPATPDRAQIRREVVEETKALVRKLTAVVEDFLPNIGRCALQDYGRLNEALCESRAFLAEQEADDGA